MTWRRLNANAIENAAGFQIYREQANGRTRFVVYGPPGSFLEVHGASMLEAMARDLGVPESGIQLSAKDARACLGGWDTAEEARRACSTRTG